MKLFHWDIHILTLGMIKICTHFMFTQFWQILNVFIFTILIASGFFNALGNIDTLPPQPSHSPTGSWKSVLYSFVFPGMCYSWNIIRNLFTLTFKISTMHLKFIHVLLPPDSSFLCHWMIFNCMAIPNPLVHSPIKSIMFLFSGFVTVYKTDKHVWKHLYAFTLSTNLSL